jgi:hypothetical protein
MEVGLKGERMEIPLTTDSTDGTDEDDGRQGFENRTVLYGLRDHGVFEWEFIF